MLISFFYVFYSVALVISVLLFASFLSAVLSFIAIQALKFSKNPSYWFAKFQYNLRVAFNNLKKVFKLKHEEPQTIFFFRNY